MRKTRYKDSLKKKDHPQTAFRRLGNDIRSLRRIAIAAGYILRLAKAVFSEMGQLPLALRNRLQEGRGATHPPA